MPTARSTRRSRFEPRRSGRTQWRSSSRATLWKGASAPLGKARVADIYEGRVTSWREVGGLERRTAFFNKEPRRGTWEGFAHWVYGVPILIVASVHDHRVAGAWS